MNSTIYPLAAVVGTAPLKLALCLSAIDPRIGGVLITGPRGMAKSTLARSVVELLPSPCFVNLPLGATEDRLIGTLDIDAILGEQRVRFSAGLLAKADGGVLYVDEVNLLPDHLVDLLLDVCASGVNFVERDGVSHQHSARFVLIGTMNPDEGSLRPQLLDRFGLSVELDGRPAPAERIEIAKRRLSFDENPADFRQQWQAEQQLLIRRCIDARCSLESIPLSDHAMELIAQRCFDAGVEGLRADIVWLRAARAHAAWRGSLEIETEDVDAVEVFVLQHRTSSFASADNITQSREEAKTEQQGTPPSSSEENPADNSDWGALPPRPMKVGSARNMDDWVTKKKIDAKKHQALTR